MKPGFSREFVIEPGANASLAKRDPENTGAFRDKAVALRDLKKNIERLADLHELLYAESRRALLIILQAMDAGGKDGTIRHVMTGVNPQGCQVTSFKVPSGEETKHDYLWRVHKAIPPSGYIGIFNRSHYEDVLVVRVHKLIPKEVWTRRYDEINAFEKMLAANDVRILKFFLHISPGEQKKRLEQRLSDPIKNWKVSDADFAERKLWDDYMQAYEDAIAKCSTEWAPWHVIPADRKWFRNLAVSSIIVETLESMDLKYPRLPANAAHPAPQGKSKARHHDGAHQRQRHSQSEQR